MMFLFIVLSVNCKDTVKTLVFDFFFFNKKQWKIQIQSLLFFLIKSLKHGTLFVYLFSWGGGGGGVVYLFCFVWGSA